MSHHEEVVAIMAENGKLKAEIAGLRAELAEQKEFADDYCKHMRKFSVKCAELEAAAGAPLPYDPYVWKEGDSWRVGTMEEFLAANGKYTLVEVAHCQSAALAGRPQGEPVVIENCVIHCTFICSLCELLPSANCTFPGCEYFPRIYVTQGERSET
jgi:hypothetical protein